MCDTILAPPSSTADGNMLFGKNSDRQCNEAQTVEFLERAVHPANAQLQCTYITIPQVRCTHAILLCRPFWIWGAEMGANEYGVAIGNEGVHARIPAPKERALVGMDLLRLGLERGETAEQAVDVITTLLEQHGQGGNCGHLEVAYYNNSYIVADSDEAYVLETIGQDWLVERVQGVRAISNGYTITDQVHRHSEGVPALMRELGWQDRLPIDYATAIADPNREHIGNAGARRACSTSTMRARSGQLTVTDMMSLLRNHGHGDRLQSEWNGDCIIRRTVCMHAGGSDRPGQTVGSMVSELRDGAAVHWVTGTAAPCISIFKPVVMDVPLPDHGSRPTDRFDERTLWWRHELLHRAALLDEIGRFLDDIEQERDALEGDFRSRIASVLSGGSAPDRAQVVRQCWAEAMQMENTWLARLPAPGGELEQNSYREYWRCLNRLAGL